MARRRAALALGAALGIVVGGLGASAAFAAPSPEPLTVTATAPAGSTQVWIDLEGADPAEVQVTLSAPDAADQPVSWAATVAGAGFRGAAQPGDVTASVVASAEALAAEPALALTFADDAGTVLAEQRTTLAAKPDGGTDGTTDGSTEGGTDGPTDGSTDGSGTSAGPGSGTGAKPGGPLARTGSGPMLPIALLAGVLVLGGGAALALRGTRARRAAGHPASVHPASTDSEEPRA